MIWLARNFVAIYKKLTVKSVKQCYEIKIIFIWKLMIKHAELDFRINANK